MIMVTGGVAQGHIGYVRELLKDRHSIEYEGLSLADYEKIDIAKDEVLVIKDANEVIRGELAGEFDCKELARRLADLEERCALVVLICYEVGCGIVPIDANDRYIREATGRVQTELALCADSVIRVICGIGQVLK